ncbi:MAG: glycosyltransferase family 1 protein [Lachnospiraceae bacterium]|jgi:glycosyltransferase involved in cell wall biosynthesis|nr:glycosyltransferase family 1 protein [Lachnospiraceae bacterium]MCH4030050.1 glycosyltransferase family 1 protein [Lachnospiraceae bacterium]MCH4070290.1 glycosyltransferase family 1 protein [Lachnospiraceae bacterium]MCH4107802.1 glycosyltransferase family 1 protein [Lachnospiraceae bacterium]MCI1361501.1 glycosyltransferase family 1 protein [Lachnospiraceae bacterium]
MKKILVFGITDNPGGVESFLMNYYRKIDRSKLQFDFLCNTEKVAYEEEILSLGGKIYRIPARSFDRKAFQTELNHFMQKHAAEYCAIWENVCSLANIDYLTAALKYGIPRRIIHSHNAENPDSFLRGLLHRINRYRVKRTATDFWACSEEAAKWFYGSSKGCRIIPNAIDIPKFKYDVKVREEYRRNLGIEQKHVIGHVGRFHFQKNHEFLIHVFAKVVSKDPKAHLLLVGQGELEEKIKQLVSSMDMDEHVTFLGVRGDMPQLYQAMDLFVLPSVFEGLPVVSLEAQASGLPCVLADSVSAEAKVNENVQYLSLNDSEDIWAEAIKEAMNYNLEKRSDQSKMLKSRFNIDTQIGEFEKEFV